MYCIVNIVGCLITLIKFLCWLKYINCRRSKYLLLQHLTEKRFLHYSVGMLQLLYFIACSGTILPNQRSLPNGSEFFLANLSYLRTWLIDKLQAGSFYFMASFWHHGQGQWKVNIDQYTYVLIEQTWCYEQFQRVISYLGTKYQTTISFINNCSIYYYIFLCDDWKIQFLYVIPAFDFVVALFNNILLLVVF